MPADTLAWSVERAETTHHLATSTLETRDAAAGTRFVVLDVRVRNPDTQPQVVSEGELVAVGASGQQRFTTPVSMLADEFLTLQVLPPAASARGRIAYEVPEGLAGEFYWTPGNSRQRILLHLQATPAPLRTLAIVDPTPVRAPSPAAADAPTPSSIAPGVLKRDAPAARQAKPARAPEPAPAREVARATPAAPPTRKTTAPRAGEIVIPAAQEQARRDRCEAMLTRNAAADEGLRPFYLLNCPDYPLPPAWRASNAGNTPPIVAAATQTAPPSGCGAGGSQAARLVCDDAFLASLDRRLAQSLSRALETVVDPAGLRREQDDWQVRVRDRCTTIRCLKLAYGRRTAHVDALARSGR